MHLNYMEFIESLGRIAEKVSLQPLKMSESDWSFEKRRNLELHLKIESLMGLLYENCANRAFKESFKLPNQSFFLMEFSSNQQIKEKKPAKMKIKLDISINWSLNSWINYFLLLLLYIILKLTSLINVKTIRHQVQS